MPVERLSIEQGLLAELPSLRPEVGARPTTRKVDKLLCIRFGSARYSVPNRLIGTTVTVVVDEQDRLLRVLEPLTGEVLAEHLLVAPGETSIVDAHYDRPRPDTPRRGARARTATEREFLDLGPVAEQFLVGAAAAGVTKLGSEIAEILTLHAAHGTDALLVALERAVAFGRWRAADVRSILATNGHAPRPTPAGQALVLTLPCDFAQCPRTEAMLDDLDQGASDEQHSPSRQDAFACSVRPEVVGHRVAAPGPQG